MTRTGLLFIVLAFAGGGFIGYLGGAGSQEVVVGTNHRTDEPGPDERPEPEAPPMPATPPGGYTSLEHALEAIPYTVARDGDGIFSGTVRTDDGKPLSGVTVRATLRTDSSRRGRQGSGVPEDESLEEVVRKYVARIMSDRKNRREGITDEQGRFLIAGIGDGKYWLQAFRDGYSFQAVGNRYYDIEAGAEVEFTARPLRDLRVTITMPDGTAPEKAQLQVRLAQGSSTSLPWIPDDPTVELAAGTHTLVAMAGEAAEYSSDPQTVSIVEGEVPAPLEFALHSRPGIRGEVTMPEGERSGQAYVYVMHLKPGQTADAEQLRQESLNAWIHPQNRKYAFYDLPPGTYAVGLTFDRRSFPLIETVEVKDELVVKDLTVPEPPRQDYLVVRVTGPGGRRPGNPGFSVYFRRGEGGRSGGSSRTAEMDDGTWRVWHPAIQGEGEGTVTYELDVTSQEYGQKTVPYDRTPASEVAVVFEDPGTVEVTIAGYAGSGSEGEVGLTLEPDSKGGSGHFWFHPNQGNQPDAEGKQTFTAVAPGEYRIVIFLKRDGGQYHPAARVPFTVKPGRNTAVVNLPSFHTVTVLMPGGDGNSTVSIRPKEPQNGAYFGQNEKVTDGKAVFEKVPAGTYLLQGRVGGSYGNMEITVPGQSVVRFEPVVQDSLRVEITDANGRYAKQGLMNGDVVVAIDGVELTDARQAITLLRAAFVKPQAVLTVLRGRGRAELPVDLRPSGGDPGGRFTPAAR